MVETTLPDGLETSGRRAYRQFWHFWVFAFWMIFSASQKNGFWCLLYLPFYGIGATICIDRELLCLPYAGFFWKIRFLRSLLNSICLNSSIQKQIIHRVWTWVNSPPPSGQPTAHIAIFGCSLRELPLKFVRANRAQINKKWGRKLKYKGQYIKILVTKYYIHPINMMFLSLLGI